MGTLDKHMSEDLPMLEEVLGPDGSKETAIKFIMTKKLTPTRPHLDIPEHLASPPDSAANFLKTPIDKLKDQFTKFPTIEMFEESEKRPH